MARYRTYKANHGERAQPGVFVSGYRDDFEPDSSRVGVTPAKLGSLLNQADMGNTLALFEFFEAVEEDAHVMAALSKRKNQVIGRTLEIASVNPGDKAADRAAELANEQIANIPDWQQAMLDMLDAIGKGFSLQQIVWGNRGDEYVVQALERYPQKFTIVGQPWSTNVDEQETDEVFLVTDDELTNGIPLHPNGWVVHKHKARSAALHKCALLRPVSWWYLYKRFSARDWAAFLERYGMPLRLGKYPVNAGDTERAALKSAVLTLGRTAGAVLPEGCSIEFIQGNNSAGSGVSPFLEHAKFCNGEISKVILGSTMTLDVPDAGARSLGEVHASSEVTLADLDAQRLATTIRQQLIRPMIIANLGDAPLPLVSFVEPKQVDLKVRAERDKIVLTEIGLTGSVAQLREVYGIAEPVDEDDAIGGKQPIPAALQPSPEPEPVKSAAAIADQVLALVKKKQSIDWVG